VLLIVVSSIESDCSEHSDMTEMTLILSSVHTSNDSLQNRRVPISVVTRIESDCSEQGDMRKLTPIVKCAHVQRELAETTRTTQRGLQHRK
jgi:hypothetical protein